jgi:hypothetical protein
MAFFPMAYNGGDRVQKIVDFYMSGSEGVPPVGTSADYQAAIRQMESMKKSYKPLLRIRQDIPSGGAAKDAMIEYQLAYNEARKANEDRYQEMLNIADRTTGQRAADIQTAYNAKAAAGQQRLVNTGLANTTVAPTMALGYEREKQAALDRNADAQQQTRLGIMERRTDDYPDSGVLLNLLQYYGDKTGR